MNRERAIQMLPIVQAMAEGKQIQRLTNPLSHNSSEVWRDVDEIGFPMVGIYRIKPEPRVFYGIEYPDDSISMWTTEAERDGVWNLFRNRDGEKKITVIEQL